MVRLIKGVRFASSGAKSIYVLIQMACILLCVFLSIERIFWRLHLETEASSNGRISAASEYHRGERYLLHLGPIDDGYSLSGDTEKGLVFKRWPASNENEVEGIARLFQAPARTSATCFVEGFNETMLLLIKRDEESANPENQEAP